MWRYSFWFMILDGVLWLLVKVLGRVGRSRTMQSWASSLYGRYYEKYDLEHSDKAQSDQKKTDSMRRLERSLRLAAARLLSVLSGDELKTPPQGDWPDQRLPVTLWRGISGVDNCRTGDSMMTRYIKDVAFIQEFRGKHPCWAFLWRWSCFYGQSFLLWAFWCALVAFVFGVIYGEFGLLDLRGKQDTGFTHLYFSIVTFTTLGFGDIAPVKAGSSLAAEILVTLEVILGYIGLGGLISILANKVARRA